MTTAQQKHGIGTFSQKEDIEEALNRLHGSGFPMEQVSIVGKTLDEKNVGGVEMGDRVGDAHVDAANSVVGNTATISATGFTLVGLTSLAIPGLGPLIAAGSLGVALLATATSSGVAAVAANQLVQALEQTGLPEEKARAYSDELHRGRYLMMVEGSDDEMRQLETVMGDRDMAQWEVY